jgi:hypothetical protein
VVVAAEARPARRHQQPPSSASASCSNVLILNCSLRLSRACPGKKIVFKTTKSNAPKNNAFSRTSLGNGTRQRAAHAGRVTAAAVLVWKSVWPRQ